MIDVRRLKERLVCKKCGAGEGRLMLSVKLDISGSNIGDLWSGECSGYQMEGVEIFCDNCGNFYRLKPQPKVVLEDKFYEGKELWDLLVRKFPDITEYFCFM